MILNTVPLAVASSPEIIRVPARDLTNLYVTPRTFKLALS